jgi:hypothetical protein
MKKLYEITYTQEPVANKIQRAIRYAESSRHAAIEWRNKNLKYPVKIIGIRQV